MAAKKPFWMVIIPFLDEKNNARFMYLAYQMLIVIFPALYKEGYRQESSGERKQLSLLKFKR